MFHKRYDSAIIYSVQHPIVNKVYEMLCVIWYHLYNLKNIKNTHGGVLLLVKLQAEEVKVVRKAATKVADKVALLYGCFSRF